MAPKTKGLNIGDTDAILKALGRPKTISEIFDQYNLGLAGKGDKAGLFIPPIGQMQTSPGEGQTTTILKGLGNIGLAGLENLRKGTGLISAFTNPAGNIVGDFLSRESPEGFKERLKIRDKTKDPTGPELFLPDEDAQLKGKVGAKKMSDVSGMDIFTEAGQNRLTQETAKAIQDQIGKSQPDARAFSAGDFADADTIAKVQKEAETDTSAPDSDIDYTGDVTEEDLETATEAGEGQALTNAQKATKGALDEFLKQVKPGIKPKEYADYIKEFGEATGLDISGDPDTKQALMSFGLALMQNRAGKGFNLSNILGAVGEAGEAAMPEFSKAVSEAKAIRAKAGAFALSIKKEDQAAAMNRANYYIIPKGKTGGIKGLAENFEKGQNVMLNSFELNALNENAKFNEQFEIVPDSIYEKAAKAYFETPEYGEKYLASRENISLFNDAPDDLSISIARVNQNYKGPDMPKLGFYNAANYEDDFNKLQRVDRDLDKIANKLKTAFRITDDGKVDFFGQTADGVVSLARAFDIDLGDRKPTDTATVKYLLESVAAQKAPQILGEAGKTISDADRDRVTRIVGSLGPLTDRETLKLALKEVYELIVIEGKLDVQQGLTKLNRYAKKAAPKFGVTYNVAAGTDGIFDVTTEPGGTSGT